MVKDMRNNEKVLWKGNADIKAVVGKIIGSIFILLFIAIFFIGPAVMIGAGQLGIIHIIIVSVFVLIMGATIVYSYFLVKKYKYTITNQAIISEGGIFLKFKRRVPYHKITDTTIRQNILEQCLGISTLALQTAGAGYRKAEIILIGQVDPETPDDLIQKQIQKIQGRIRSGE